MPKPLAQPCRAILLLHPEGWSVAEHRHMDRVTWEQAQRSVSAWEGGDRLSDYRYVVCLPATSGWDSVWGERFLSVVRESLENGGCFLFLANTTAEEEKNVWETEKGLRVDPRPASSRTPGRYLLEQILSFGISYVDPARRVAPRRVEHADDAFDEHVDKHACHFRAMGLKMRIADVPRYQEGIWWWGATKRDAAALRGLAGSGSWALLPWAGNVVTDQEVGRLFKVLADLEDWANATRLFQDPWKSLARNEARGLPNTASDPVKEKKLSAPEQVSERSPSGEPCPRPERADSLVPFAIACLRGSAQPLPIKELWIRVEAMQKADKRNTETWGSSKSLHMALKREMEKGDGKSRIATDEKNGKVVFMLSEFGAGHAH